MNEFIDSFGEYWSEGQFGSFSFWVLPLIILVFIWIVTVVGLKVFTGRKRLKTVFIIVRAWAVSAMIAALVLVAAISYLWTRGFFSQSPLELSFLLSLFMSMAIPVIGQIVLNGYYNIEGIREITAQPKTPLQLESTISSLKRAFGKNKLVLLMPAVGFIMLLFALNQGNNLISIVFDNSESMENSNAIEALSETFNNLDENNEIILATLEGLQAEDGSDGKSTLDQIMSVQHSSGLKAGNVISFDSPSAAISGLDRISNECQGSPICETIWKSYLFAREVKPDETFDNKLMVLITDGEDNLVGQSLLSGKFLFDDAEFSEYYSSERIFVIDYSDGRSNPLMQRFRNSGSDIYNVENNKEDYISALDNALQTFMSDWNLIYWVIFVYAFSAVILLVIQPKKIV